MYNLITAVLIGAMRKKDERQERYARSLIEKFGSRSSVDSRETRGTRSHPRSRPCRRPLPPPPSSPSPPGECCQAKLKHREA